MFFNFKKIIIILIVITFSMWGQHIQTRQYTIADGLVQSQVNTIVQDGQGRMWFGTVSGLSVYDGISFKTLNKKSLAIPSTYIISSFYDSSSATLWFGTIDEGIFAISGDSLLTVITEINGHQMNRVNVMVGLQDKILLGTNSGLGILNPVDNSIQFPKIDLPDQRINAITLDNGNRIVLGTLRGIAILNEDYSIAYWLDNKTGMINTFVNALAAISDSVILVGGRRGLTEITLGSKITISEYNDPKVLKHPFVNTIFQSASGSIWIGSGQGILKFEERHLKHYKMKDFFYKTIFQDREKNIWFGSRGGGVLKLTEEMFINYNLEDGLPNQEILSIFSHPDGSMWYGTNNGCFTVKNDIIKSYKLSKSPYSNIVTDFALINRELYMTTWNGIFKFKNQKFSALSITGPHSKIRRWQYIFKFAHNVYVSSGRNLFKLDKNRLTPVDMPSQDYFISDIRLLNRENLLVVAVENSVILFNESMKIVREIQIPNRELLSIIPDIYKYFNIGTDQGMLYFDGEKIHSNFPGAASISVFDILGGVYDTAGQLWLGTNTGLVKFFNGRIKRYTTQEGFIGDEMITNRSLSTDLNGNIHVGTFIGLSVCRPSKEQENTVSPTVLIKNIELPDREIAANTNNPQFNPDENSIRFNYVGISFRDESEVRYQTLLLGFESDWSKPASANSVKYVNLPQGEYQFQVRAINGNQLVSKQPAIFNFRVLGPIYLRTWFLAIVVILLAMIIYITHQVKIKRVRSENIRLDNLVQARTSELNDEKEKLLAANFQLDMKTNELSDALQKLQQAQDQLVQTNKIAALGRLINGIVKEINDPLAYIYTNSFHLRQYIEEIEVCFVEIKKTIPEKLLGDIIEKNDIHFIIGDMGKIVKGFESTLSRIVNILDNLNIYGLKPYELVPLDLIQELNASVNSILTKFPNLILDINNDFEGDCIVLGDSLQLQQAFSVILQNSGEFTGGSGSVEIAVKLTEEIVTIHFKDDGPGIDPASVDKVFEPFYTTRKETQKLGLGLAIALGIINHFDGTIKVDKKASSGAHLIVTLPVFE